MLKLNEACWIVFDLNGRPVTCINTNGCTEKEVKEYCVKNNCYSYSLPIPLIHRLANGSFGDRYEVVSQC